MYLYSTLDDEQFQLLDAYICISSHYRQLYSRNILCSCLKQPQLYNNSPFNYIETVDGSFVNRFPFLPGTCCCISVYNSFQLKQSLYKVSRYSCYFSYIPCSDCYVDFGSIEKNLFMTTEMLHMFPHLMSVKLIQGYSISTVVVVVVVFHNFLLQCL